MTLRSIPNGEKKYESAFTPPMALGAWMMPA